MANRLVVAKYSLICLKGFIWKYIFGYPKSNFNEYPTVLFIGLTNGVQCCSCMGEDVIHMTTVRAMTKRQCIFYAHLQGLPNVPFNGYLCGHSHRRSVTIGSGLSNHIGRH